MGPVTNVVLFDKEPDGVASVRYGNAEAAKACVDVSFPFLKTFIHTFHVAHSRSEPDDPCSYI